ncbi:MAG: ribose-phosphate pyrophosphokinase [Patescibacteria group bacterium]|nr:ribose-phosphate pyrophosphokinase [Patescibacteria group bacterium]MDE2116875.1 ribose-phosphate pyrophosphokinase [Patescibacteria group bacterium]
MNIAILSPVNMSPMARQITTKLQNDPVLRENGHVYEHIEFTTRVFPSGELLPEIPLSVRSKRVYLLHCPALPEPNVGYMELLLVLNALKLAWVESATVVAPYLPYFRQDRKADDQRVPISARVIADLIKATGIVKGIITMDLHVDQEQAFFDCPTQNLSGRAVFGPYLRQWLGIKRIPLDRVIVSSTDLGGSKRAQRFARAIDPSIPVGTLLKERKAGSEVDSLGYIGPDVRDKTVILYDDMIDTGHSIVAGVQALNERSADEVIVCGTHGVFSGGAEELLRRAHATTIALDTIPRRGSFYHRNCGWLKVLSIADYLTDVIRESHRDGGSVSAIKT